MVADFDYYLQLFFRFVENASNNSVGRSLISAIDRLVRLHCYFINFSRMCCVYLGLVTMDIAVDRVRGIQGRMGIKIIHQEGIMTERMPKTGALQE